MSYKVSPIRRPAYVITVLCFLCGCILLLSPLFGQKHYVAVTQIFAVGFFLAAMLVTNRYLLTNYLYEIEIAPNPLSELPKLNIYASRGHNFGHQFYCVPLEKAYGIEARAAKAKGKEKPGFPVINCCGSMYPTATYLVKYDCDGKVNGVLLECDELFANEIAEMISRHGLSAGESHEKNEEDA